MSILTIDEHIRLEPTALPHAAGLLQAVDSNREHLSRFLPWVNNMQTVQDFERYIQQCELLSTQGAEVSFVIFYNEKIAGRIGIHYIHAWNRSGAIGYWLAKEFEGHGIMTRACRAVIQYGFEKLHLNRIELKAAVNNTRSQAIPEKLHFFKEGILREAEKVNDEFLDLYQYALLRSDYESNDQFKAQ